MRRIMVVAAVSTGLLLAGLLLAVPGAAQAKPGKAHHGVAPVGAHAISKEEKSLLQQYTDGMICVAAIGAFVAGNATWIYKVRKAGGMVAAAKRVLSAADHEAKLKALTGLFTNAIGLDTIAQNC